MSNIIRVGSATRSITNNFTDQERNVLGRELAEKIGELSSIDGRIKAVYELRETEVLALEDQRKTLDNEIKRLQVSVSSGSLEEQIQCDVYDVGGAERIVVKSGCLPTDISAIIETTALYANADPSVAEAPAVSEIQPVEEPRPVSEIRPVEEALPVSEIQPVEEAPAVEVPENI